MDGSDYTIGRIRHDCGVRAKHFSIVANVLIEVHRYIALAF